MDIDIKLSPNFTLVELTKSTVSDRFNISNDCPSEEVYDNLKRLALNILEPVRTRFGQFKVTSAYRSSKVNEKSGGGAASTHVLGTSADFEIAGATNYDVAEWIMNSLDFDQLILENYVVGKPYSGWVHCSYVSKEKNRRQVLTVTPDQTVMQGLLA
jgi:hypothetical protein